MGRESRLWRIILRFALEWKSWLAFADHIIEDIDFFCAQSFTDAFMYLWEIELFYFFFTVKIFLGHAAWELGDSDSVITEIEIGCSKIVDGDSGIEVNHKIAFGYVRRSGII